VKSTPEELDVDAALARRLLTAQFPRPVRSPSFAELGRRTVDQTLTPDRLSPAGTP
jgi:hypothetical protein